MADRVDQRIDALRIVYVDLNDHDRLRRDPVMQTAVGLDKDAAGLLRLTEIWMSFTGSLHYFFIFHHRMKRLGFILRLSRQYLRLTHPTRAMSLKHETA